MFLNLMKLTFEDFKSDYQHLVVRDSKVYEVINHIEKYYDHISKECLNYINCEKK